MMPALGKRRRRTWTGRTAQSRESGTAAIEFALVVPPFLVLMLGIGEYARYEWTAEAVRETAIAGARCIGMTLTNCSSNGTRDTSSAVAFIQSEAQKWGLTLPAPNIQISTAATCNGVSGFSQVRLTYTFRSVVPTLTNFITTGDVITESACFPA